jgi:hypothetical protein
MRELTPGLEFYGGVGFINNTEPIKEQQHYIFPVIKGELPIGLEYNFGVGVGLTSGSDHVVVKFNLALEKYIGAISGPKQRLVMVSIADNIGSTVDSTSRRKTKTRR